MATIVAEDLRPDPRPPTSGWSSPRRRSARCSNGTTSSSTARSPHGIIGKTFFPSDNETVQTLLAWAGFAVGFGFRPLGAVLFGFLGDRLGRKYTFLVTITLMGIATAGVGFVPPGVADRAVRRRRSSSCCACCRGWRWAANMAGRRSMSRSIRRRAKRGFYTSFIQASVAGGFILSLAVVLLTKFVGRRRRVGGVGLAVPVHVLAACCSRCRCGCG